MCLRGPPSFWFYRVNSLVYMMCILYTRFMDEFQQMGIRDFRAEITERVEAAHFRNEPTVVTKNGEPRAALVPYSWLKDMKPPKEQT